MIDQNSTIGLAGTFASWGLSEIHLAGALVASALTSIYMIICICKSFKQRKD